jgi:Tfp pilus assembly protein PilO
VSTRDKTILGLVAVVAALAAGWFTVGSPKRSEMAELDTQIAAKQAEVDGVASRAAQYRAARDELRRNPDAFANAGRALPNRVQMPDLLRTLTRTARQSGVAMGNLSTSAGGAGATPGINAVNLTLDFEGEFLALQRFLGRLQTMVDVSEQNVAAKGRLLALNKLQLVPGDGSLGAKVDATVYVLQPSALGASAPAAVPPAATATPTTPTPGAAP